MQHSQKWLDAMHAMRGENSPQFKNAKKTGVCKMCGKEFKYYVGSSTGQFCSQACSNVHPETRLKRSKNNRGRKWSKKDRARMSKQRKGQKKSKEWQDNIRAALKAHWDKRGRKTDLAILIRTSPEYETWRLNVLRRAFYKCEKCGIGNVQLDAHHIIPFSVLLEEHRLGLCSEQQIHDEGNGISLCRECHKKAHANGTWFKNLVEGQLLIALRDIYEAGDKKETFAEFYRDRMGRLVEWVKKKLPKK